MARKTESLSPELIQAITAKAQQDADATADFLDQYLVSRQLRRDGIRWPKTFLLGLGAVMRVFLWEAAGIRLHLDSGLPDAYGILETIVRLVNSDDHDYVRTLQLTILRLAIERTAWEGHEVLRAEVELGEAEEAVLVEALARLAWEHRKGRQ